MRDLTILGQTALVIIGGVCIAIALAIYCWLTGSDNPLDEDADGEGFGRVASRPGSTRFAPGASCTVSACGNDPSRGGTVRAFNDGE